MFNIGNIFYFDEQYSERADYCNANGLMIVEIEPDEKGKRYQIQEIPPPTEEEQVEYLRRQRETECFSIINRGQLWYNRLSAEQYEELIVWYQAWLDVTDTKVVPEKPSWLI